MKIEVTPAMIGAALASKARRHSFESLIGLNATAAVACMRAALEAALAAMPERDGEAVAIVNMGERPDALGSRMTFTALTDYGKTLPAGKHMLYTTPPAPVRDWEATQKYDDVLMPFVAMMRSELHANAGKGDRPGWLKMDGNTAMLEIYHHAAKLQRAMHKSDSDGVREYAADVANMSMMLVDVCGLLPVVTPSPDAAVAMGGGEGC